MQQFQAWVESQGNITHLAARLGVTRQAIYKWIKRETIPNPEMLAVIKKASGLSYEQIIKSTMPISGKRRGN